MQCHPVSNEVGGVKEILGDTIGLRRVFSASETHQEAKQILKIGEPSRGRRRQVRADVIIPNRLTEAVAKIQL